MMRIPLPAADEYAPYYGRYIAGLATDDAYAALESQGVSTARLLGAAGERQGAHRYAPGKWSVKEVVGHITDAERVFAYRALCVARGDRTPLPGFDENAYVPSGRFDLRPLAGLAAELAVVRAGTLALFAGLDEDALAQRGTANGQPVTPRALAAIIAGHEHHHVTLLRERYGLVG